MLREITRAPSGSWCLRADVLRATLLHPGNRVDRGAVVRALKRGGAGGAISAMYAQTGLDPSRYPEPAEIWQRVAEDDLVDGALLATWVPVGPDRRVLQKAHPAVVRVTPSACQLLRDLGINLELYTAAYRGQRASHGGS